MNSIVVKRRKDFTNGTVYCLELKDGMLIEVTDTFLPFYTKDAIGMHQNTLSDTNYGSRKERWMIGVSVMSGCPVRCKFCATGQMKKWRNLTAEEIVEQVNFVISQNPEFNPFTAAEFKINYTRMGEPALNIENVKFAIEEITKMYPNVHHYVSTIGVLGTDFDFVKDNVTLQISLHSLDSKHRDWLIPYRKKMSIADLGKIRTDSHLKTTLNLTLVDESDFDVNELKKYFDKDKFFIKLSPINTNAVSDGNHLGAGVIETINF
jgi:23S rRNA (adenine2503-C2)-methyltransferase